MWIIIEPTKDEKLVGFVLAGDAESFSKLVERYFGMVYTIGYARFRERERSEDLAQEVFLQAYLQLAKLKHPKLFSAWISQIARNLAINWEKQELRRSQLVLMVPMEELSNEVPDLQSKGAREQMENKEQNTLVQEAIFQLTPDLREIVLLHYSEDLSKQEISTLLGIHPSTVGRHLKKALAILQGIIEPSLRESVKTIHPSQKARLRTMTLIAVAASMPVSSKATLVIASGGIAQASATSLANSGGGMFGFLKTLTPTMLKGGQFMSINQAMIIIVSIIVILGGGHLLYTQNFLSPTVNQPIKLEVADTNWQKLSGLYPVRSAEKRRSGLIDRTGKMVVEPIFEGIQFSTGRLAWVQLDRKWGVINEKGEMVIEPRQYEITGFFKEGLAWVRMGGKQIENRWEGGKCGYINEEGKLVIEMKFDETQEFSNGFAGVKIGDKWGFIDKTGEIVILPQYENVMSFSEGLGRIQIGNKWGYIDKNGKTIVQPKFDTADSFTDGLARVSFGNQWGFITKSGEYGINPIYTQLGTFSDGLVSARKDDKWGYLDKKGRMIITPQYEKVLECHEGLMGVQIHDKWAYIDPTGKIIIKPQFDKVQSFSEGLAAVQVNEKWGYVDKTGAYAISPILELDYAGSFEDGIARVRHTGNFSYIDKTGKYVWQPQK